MILQEFFELQEHKTNNLNDSKFVEQMVEIKRNVYEMASSDAANSEV
jgi:hypothetical protein